MEPSYTPPKVVPTMRLPRAPATTYRSSEMMSLSERTLQSKARRCSKLTSSPRIRNVHYVPIFSDNKKEHISLIKKEKRKNVVVTNQEEWDVLHPDITTYDTNGEIMQHMMKTWLYGVNETTFTSIVLFCDMKLQEAKRIAARVEVPNRFLTFVAIKLLDKMASRLGSTGKVLQQLNTEIMNSIYAQPDNIPLTVSSVEDFVPYFSVRISL